jgi:hypothetical protein
MVGIWLNSVRMRRWVFLHSRNQPFWKVIEQKLIYRAESVLMEKKTLSWKHEEQPLADITATTDEVELLQEGLPTEILAKKIEV